jgi:hypothetical protein
MCNNRLNGYVLGVFVCSIGQDIVPVGYDSIQSAVCELTLRFVSNKSSHLVFRFGVKKWYHALFFKFGVLADQNKTGQNNPFKSNVHSILVLGAKLDFTS